MCVLNRCNNELRMDGRVCVKAGIKCFGNGSAFTTGSKSTFWGALSCYKFDLIAAAKKTAHTLYSFPEGCKPSVAIKEGSVAAIRDEGVISI